MHAVEHDKNKALAELSLSSTVIFISYFVYNQYVCKKFTLYDIKDEATQKLGLAHIAFNIGLMGLLLWKDYRK